MVLGPQSKPTLVVQTPALPAGSYLVNATVSAVIANHDMIVCYVSPSAGGGGNYVFGTAGNGAGTKGDGGAIYGTAPIADVVTVKTAGTHIERIYSKIGASTRSTATLFAMQHGLLETLDPFDL